MRIGVALSGGGIKSFSQLPVLEALHKKGIKISYLAGTSMGSAIAALAACGPDIETMIPLALSIEEELEQNKIFVKPSPKLLPFVKEKIHGGYVDGAVIEDILDPVFAELGVINIKDVQIPLAIPSVDIVTGKLIVFVSHPELFKAEPDWVIVSDVKLSTAVRASCSFPFIIAACPFKDYMLTDGGVRMNLPLDLVEAYGSDKTVAVTMHQQRDFQDIDNLLPLANRIMDLMADTTDQYIIPRADVHFNIPLDDIWVFDIGKGSTTIDAGYDVMNRYQHTLEHLLEKPSFWDRLLGKK